MEEMVMRNQKGFTLIELLIVIVIIGILAAVAIPRFQGVSDKAKIGAAKAELATVKNLLGMYQAENDTSAYPAAADVTSHAELVTILEPYGGIPAASEASWTFVSYARATEDTFVLTGKADDRNRTVITVTPTVITP
jgi:general secretion pathway protein G